MTKTESITLEFNTVGDVVHTRVTNYSVETVDPEIVIQALYDLAHDEERSWLRWCRKQEMKETLQSRRN